MSFALLVALAELDRPEFERDVRPILAAHCVRCHGPEKQKGGLRLDHGAGARQVLGAAGDSELLRRVTSADEEERMPLGAEALTAEELATLRAWIEAGAEWPDAALERPRSEHWAYQPVRRPTPPAVADERAVRAPLDRFVQAELERAGLTPEPEAELATLARRVALDLTGLPPTPEQVDALCGDPRADAYERFVDGLLASTACAERRAQTWLDLARYADTNGYEKDDRREAWRWRDWVIAAYARNLPFDEFTVKQLAGDLLPEATLEDLVASGFHRNTLVNQEGGTDPEEFRVAAVVDRVNTTASVWLGTTLACAQCHAHKYDPFSHEDYYRLFAFFDQTEDVGNALEPRIPAPTVEDARRLAELEARVAELDAALLAPEPELDAREPAWIAGARRARAREPAWELLAPASAAARHGTTLERREDGSFLATGAAPPVEVFELEGELAHAADLLRLELLADASLPEDGPGRAGHGNFVLTDVTVEHLVDGAWRRVDLAGAEATHEQTRNGEYLARHAIDADPASGWAIWRADGTCAPETLHVALAERLAAGRVRVRLACESPHAGHALGRFRLAFAADAERARLVGLTPAERAALAAAEPSPAEALLLRRLFRASAGEPGRAAARALAAAEAELQAFRAGLPTALVMRARAEPRTTRVLAKGSFLQPGAAVTPDVPAVLPPLPADAPRDRLGLARWLVSAENPLTPRVLVNRVWGELLGTPLVASVDDFGTRGERPTHPELLDWLAAELVAGGWDVRALYRAIVTSATYRRSSRVTPELLERDPANRQLARQARPRLEAETLRDQALALGGLLDPSVGGPSVMPPQPEGVWAPVYSGDRWSTATDGARFRRGLYTFWRRGAHYLTFALFDAPSRELVCPRRARTSSPLQALALLSDPAFVEAAAGLAARVLREREGDPARLERAFRLATLRAPAPEEHAALARLLAAERARYAADPGAAAAFATHVRHAVPEAPHELAAWSSVATALLNLDEVVTRN
ncbi:MAG TPA: PSD1 and planctomycete cytochrome C domain-containing protein [Planctomycetota bacterium]